VGVSWIAEKQVDFQEGLCPWNQLIGTTLLNQMNWQCSYLSIMFVSWLDVLVARTESEGLWPRETAAMKVLGRWNLLTPDMEEESSCLCLEHNAVDNKPFSPPANCLTYNKTGTGRLCGQILRLIICFFKHVVKCFYSALCYFETFRKGTCVLQMGNYIRFLRKCTHNALV